MDYEYTVHAETFELAFALFKERITRAGFGWWPWKFLRVKREMIQLLRDVDRIAAINVTSDHVISPVHID